MQRIGNRKILPAYISPRALFSQWGYTLSEVVDGNPAAIRVTVCPECRKVTMDIYPDEQIGAWYSCSNCGLSGDSIYLFSSQEDPNQPSATLEGAARLLQANGLIASSASKFEMELSEYLSFTNEYMGYVTLWSRMQNRVIKGSKETRELMEERKSWKGYNRTSLQQALGFSIGTGWKSEFSSIFGPRTLGGLKRNDPELFICMEDYPNRLCGISTIRDQVSNVFMPVELWKKDKKAIPNEGFGFLSLAQPFDQLLLSDDPDFCLFYNFRRDALKPPIVYWASGTQNWAVLSNKRITFLCNDFRPEIVSKALELPNAKITQLTDLLTVNPNINEQMDNFNKVAMEPLHYLKQILAGVDEVTARSWGRMVGLSELRKSELISMSNPAEKERLRAILDDPEAAKRAVVRKKEVYEQDDGWYYEGERFSDAILRIETIVEDRGAQKPSSKSPELVCIGTISYRDRVIPFREYREVIRKAPTEFIRREVQRHCQMWPYIEDGWDRYLMNIAEQLHPPKVENDRSVVGWDMDLWKLSFPQFDIAGGKVTPRENGNTFAENPGGLLKSPASTSLEGTEPLVLGLDGSLDECAAVWVVLVAAACNIFRKHHELGSIGIACSGFAGELSFDVAYYVKELLTLEDLDLRGSKLSRITDALDQEEKSVLPLFVDNSMAELPLFRQWYFQHPQHPAIVPLRPFLSRASALAGDWLVVEKRTPTGNWPAKDNTGKLFVRFLAYLQTQDIKPASRGELFRFFLDKFQDWLTLEEQPIEIVPRMEDMLQMGLESSSTPGSRLLRMVCNLLDNDEIGLVPEHEEGAYEIIHKPTGEIVIRKASFQKLLQKKFGIQLGAAWHDIDRSLAQQNVLAGQEYEGEPAWIIKPDVWDNYRAWFKE